MIGYLPNDKPELAKKFPFLPLLYHSSNSDLYTLYCFLSYSLSFFSLVCFHYAHHIYYLLSSHTPTCSSPFPLSSSSPSYPCLSHHPLPLLFIIICLFPLLSFFLLLLPSAPSLPAGQQSSPAEGTTTRSERHRQRGQAVRGGVAASVLCRSFSWREWISPLRCGGCVVVWCCPSSSLSR